MIKRINTAELKSENLPPRNADWDQISLFALTFDLLAESPEMNFKNVTINEAVDENATINELRAYLYFQQRWWNNRSGGIDSSGLEKMQKVVELIRSKLA